MRAALIVFAFAFSFQISAQPGGCYSMTWRTEHCRKQRNELLQKYASEIENLDEKIALDPRSAELYYRRGELYSGLMFLAHPGYKNVEFDGRIYFADIDAKAIADYTRAIKLVPKAAYYERRGNIYRAYWEREIPSFFYLEGSQIKAKEEILKDVERLFLGNENFETAAEDFQKAVELSADYEASKRAREALSLMHSRRAFELGRNEYVAQIIGGKAEDVALADHDYVIDYYKMFVANNKPAWVKDSSDNAINGQYEKNLLYESWLAKGITAAMFGRDDVALEAFKQAEKYWYKTALDCRVYANRAAVFLKRGNFEAALRDLTFAVESGNWNCRSIVKLRADIYLSKGDFGRAVEDYTAYLATGYGTYDKEIFFKRGRAYLKQGEFEKAVADFTTAISSSSLCEKDYLLRAQAYRSAGDEEAARADEERAKKTLKEQKNYQPSDYCYYHEQ